MRSFFQTFYSAGIFALMLVVTCLAVSSSGYPEADGLSKNFWSPPGGIVGYDEDSGTWRPVSADASGAIDVNNAVPASWTQSTLTASTSVQTLTTNEKCTSLMLQQQGSTTVWLTLDGSDPVAGSHGFQLTATGTALCQQSFSIGGSAPVKYVAGAATLFEQVQSLKP